MRRPSWQSFFETADQTLLAMIVALASLGLVMVYSASSIQSLQNYSDSLFYFKRQVLFVLIGLTALFYVSGQSYQKLVSKGPMIFLICVVLLVLTLIPLLGVKVNGARRWLNLGILRIQVAEFAKIGVILYLSNAIVRRKDWDKDFWKGVVPFFVIVGLVCGLLLLQPDFGNAVLIFSILVGMLFLAGAKLRHLSVVFLAFLPTAYFLVMGEEYRKRRLMSFLDPWADPQNTSYQIVQSLTAFFSGGLSGRGLGNSREKLYYLPEVHTDFILSVVGEELGILGVGLFLSLFVLLLFRGVKIAREAPDREGFLLACGCTIYIVLQAILNFGVVMGLLPTKGLPLPFVSHGGSSLVAVFIAAGLLLSVARRSVKS